METVLKIKVQNPWSFRDLSFGQSVGRVFFFMIILSGLMLGTICLWVAAKWIDKPFAGFLVSPRMVVLSLGRPQWTGKEAGLRYPDRLVTANNKGLLSPRDLNAIVTDARIGDPIKYSVERNGQLVEFAVPTMLYTGEDLFVVYGIVVLQGIIYLLIGTVVFILKPDSGVSWLFLLACFIEGILFFISFTLSSTSPVLISSVMIFCLSFLPAIVVNFSLLFPERLSLRDRRPAWAVIPYIVSALLSTSLLLTYPRPFTTQLYRFATLYLFFSIVLFITLTLRAYVRQTSTLARQRAKVVFFGALVAFPVPAMADIVASVENTLGGLAVPLNFLSLPVLIFPAVIAYAIAKHNLFDVDVYIKRAVGYGFMTILVGSGYLLMQTTLDSYVMRPLFGEASAKVYPILFAVLVVFFFNPVNRRVQAAVDKLFFRKKFDYKQTVVSVSDALTSVLNLTEVKKRIINTVRKEMFIDTAGIILTEPKKRTCQTLFIGEGSNKVKDDIKDTCLPYDDPLLALISREKKLITKYDIAENPHYQSVRESCGRRFSEMGASVMIPLTYQGEVKGALAVGHKKSGHFYSREDIDLLSTLANHGAVAIENARMAEQMKNEEIVRTNLARYLSPQIVDQVIKKDVQVNLGGDRKVVTVLFSDIRNFTTITETMPPDRLVHILNEYFTEMAGIIFENQGSLDKYIGDAIVAVFGSLIPLENSAHNAAHAAIQMMKQLPSLNEKWMKEYGFSMDIGIGINTGEVFLGNIGSPERMEFTVIGDTVNVASRFSGLAKPRQILVTRETLAFLDSAIPYRELPPAEVKGKTGKVDVFEVVY